jgi:hypothetical protein
MCGLQTERLLAAQRRERLNVIQRWNSVRRAGALIASELGIELRVLCKHDTRVIRIESMGDACALVLGLDSFLPEVRLSSHRRPQLPPAIRACSGFLGRPLELAQRAFVVTSLLMITLYLHAVCHCCLFLFSSENHVDVGSLQELLAVLRSTSREQVSVSRVEGWNMLKHCIDFG